MKFAKFALLCAIAALLFATPRASRADGWTTGGYFYALVSSNPLPGQGTATWGWSYNAVSDSAYAGLAEADITIDSYRLFSWVGSGTPTTLDIGWSEVIRFAGEAGTGTTTDFTQSTLPTNVTYSHNAFGHFSAPRPPAAPFVRIHDSLTSTIDGIGQTNVGWSIG